MNKKLSTILIIALVTMLLGSAALAAAGHWGLLDFAGQYGGIHIPQNASDYIQTDVAAWETEALSLAMREVYYDGRYLHAVVDVKPRNPKTLLISGMCTTEDLMYNLKQQSETDQTADRRTIAQYWQESDFDQLLAISPVVTAYNDAGCDCRMQEDGTLTFYLEAGYEHHEPVRDVEFHLITEAYADPMTGTLSSARERNTFPLTLTIPEGISPVTYISSAPQEYPEAGVRIERLTIEALPLSIYASIEYSIIDEERYMPLADSLWFEFIDPASTETLPALQRLDSGFTSTGSIEVVNSGHRIQREALGANELHSEYTLRAFDAWTKTRYESRSFQMREAAPDHE